MENKKSNEAEIILNVPTRLKYYLDPIAIIVVSIAITVVIVLVGKGL